MNLKKLVFTFLIGTLGASMTASAAESAKMLNCDYFGLVDKNEAWVWSRRGDALRPSQSAGSDGFLASVSQKLHFSGRDLSVSGRLIESRDGLNNLVLVEIRDGATRSHALATAEGALPSAEATLMLESASGEFVTIRSKCSVSQSAR